MSRKRDKIEQRRFTDAELLNAELMREDANAIPNIVKEKLPDDVKIVDVICGYNHRKYPMEKIFCCKCGACQHAFGFHISCSDGRETTLGNCCAKKPGLLGPAFEKTHSRHRSEKARKSYLLDIHDLKPKMLRLVATTQGMASWYAVARGIRKGRFDLRDAMPDVFELLQNAALTNSILKVPKRVLRFDWKRNDDEREDREQGDRYEWTFHDFCHVPGRAFFERGDPLAHAEAIENAVVRFAEVMKNTDHYTTGQLRNLNVQMLSAYSSMQKLIQMRDAAEEFYGASNLHAIASWINQNRQHHGSDFRHAVEVVAGCLRNMSNGRVASKPDIAPPDMKCFNEWPMKGLLKRAA